MSLSNDGVQNEHRADLPLQKVISHGHFTTGRRGLLVPEFSLDGLQCGPRPQIVQCLHIIHAIMTKWITISLLAWFSMLILMLRVLIPEGEGYKCDDAFFGLTDACFAHLCTVSISFLLLLFL